MRCTFIAIVTPSCSAACRARGEACSLQLREVSLASALNSSRSSVQLGAQHNMMRLHNQNKGMYFCQGTHLLGRCAKDGMHRSDHSINACALRRYAATSEERDVISYSIPVILVGMYMRASQRSRTLVIRTRSV